MLVEDDENDRLFFMDAIRYMPHVTVYGVAHSADEAIEKLTGAVALPDLIVACCDMPLLTAIELLKRIKEDPIIKNIPLVFLSKDATQEEQARSLGASGFIRKADDLEVMKSQLSLLVGTDFSRDDVAFQTTPSEI